MMPGPRKLSRPTSRFLVPAPIERKTRLKHSLYAVGALAFVWLTSAAVGTISIEAELIWAGITLVVLLILESLLFGNWRKPNPRSGSRCETCDYNLTGNVSGICPECGTPFRT